MLFAACHSQVHCLLLLLQVPNDLLLLQVPTFRAL